MWVFFRASGAFLSVHAPRLQCGNGSGSALAKAPPGDPPLPSGSHGSCWRDGQNPPAAPAGRAGPAGGSTAPLPLPGPSRPPGPRKPGLGQFSLPRSLCGYERKGGSSRLPPGISSSARRCPLAAAGRARAAAPAEVRSPPLFALKAAKSGRKISRLW